MTNTSEPEMNQNYFSIHRCYRAVNTLCLGYKTSQLKIYREIKTVFFSEKRNQHITTLCGENAETFVLNPVVHIVTVEL